MASPSRRPHAGAPSWSTRTARWSGGGVTVPNVSIRMHSCNTGRRMEALASAGHIRADSVVDLAYERIRAMVVDGEIPPGARLGQVELAEQLGVSRTPVREALRRLTGEGLA